MAGKNCHIRRKITIFVKFDIKLPDKEMKKPITNFHKCKGKKFAGCFKQLIVGVWNGKGRVYNRYKDEFKGTSGLKKAVKAQKKRCRKRDIE